MSGRKTKEDLFNKLEEIEQSLADFDRRLDALDNNLDAYKVGRSVRNSRPRYIALLPRHSTSLFTHRMPNGHDGRQVDYRSADWYRPL